MIRQIQLTFLFLLSLGCSSNERASGQRSTESNGGNFPLRPVLVDTSEENVWGGDVRLSYTNKLLINNRVQYKVSSTHNAQNLGFEIVMPEDGSGKLMFKSIGPNSDSFLVFLQGLYKQKIDSSVKFINNLIVICMNMGDYVDSLNKDVEGNYLTTAQYKLFFQGENEDDYGELYLNINDQEHWIELKEKDEEYRSSIVKALSKK